MHDPDAVVRTGRNGGGRARQYERPIVSAVRPHAVRGNRLVWLPIENGRKRARLPRAV